MPRVTIAMYLEKEGLEKYEGGRYPPRTRELGKGRKDTSDKACLGMSS